MPKVDETPEKLKPYIHHGVDLTWKNDKEGEATGECPFCGKQKFSVTIEAGLFRCFSCNTGIDKGKAIKGGDAGFFINKIWEMSGEAAQESSYLALAEELGLNDMNTLLSWGVRQSILTRDWIVPGFNRDPRQPSQLYRYVQNAQRKLLLPTPTMKHGIHGVNLYDSSKQHVYVCEGWKDGLKMWEALRSVKANDANKLVSTLNVSASLGAHVNVLAVPACTSFEESWLWLFDGKTVTFFYDNDHERKHPKTNETIPPAGLEGMKRAAGLLLAADKPPTSIHYVQWGSRGWNPELPNGYDVRDKLCAVS